MPSSTPPVGVEPQRNTPRPSAAGAIVELLSPKTVLAAGSSRATLVDALRDLGVDVDELDVATGDTPPADGDASTSMYDLAICVSAPDDAVDDTGRLVAALSVGESVLFSADGPDRAGPSITADHRAEWARLFAEHGFFRDLDHDASYLAADAVLFRRSKDAAEDIVRRYEQKLHDLQQRTDADIARLEDEQQQLHREILRIRDLAFGRQAELASAQARVELLESTLARYDNLEQRLHDVLNSRSWRFTQTIGLPVRMLRQRR